MSSLYRNIVIVGDGDFPRAERPLKILKKANIIIACDGAISTLVKEGFKADYIVGDMDTLPTDEQKLYTDIICHDSDQETNDQTKAFKHSLSLIDAEKDMAYKIYFLGATGKREDHTIGNISLLADYKELIHNDLRYSKVQIELSMVSDYGYFTPIVGSCAIRDKKGERVSIFAFDPTLRVESEGLEYQTKDVVWDMWWKSTLNKITEPVAHLRFSHPAKALLYFPF